MTETVVVPDSGVAAQKVAVLWQVHAAMLSLGLGRGVLNVEKSARGRGVVACEVGVPQMTNSTGPLTMRRLGNLRSSDKRNYS